MKTAFLFPGQGSQAIGMGRDLFENFSYVKPLFEEVDEALGQSLSKIIFDSPAEDLNLTANTQPALMLISVAAAKVLEAETGMTAAKDAAFIAGHSLGEYSALTVAGTFTLAQSAKLLRLRGDAMQRAVPAGLGAMSAVIGLSLEQVEEAIQNTTFNGTCEIANDNCPGQIVISGHAAAVAAVGETLTTMGARKVVPLPVSAPFHCSLMRPAQEAMQAALTAAQMQSPCTPVVSNVTVAPTTDVNTIRDCLVQQVTGRVRWTETLQFFINQGVTNVIEIGAGKVLSGLMRRTDKSITTQTFGTLSDLEALQKEAA